MNNTVVVSIPMNTSVFKEAIEMAGSQKKLAEKSGLSQGVISKYLRGETMPSGVAAKKLERAVNFKITRDKFAPHIFDGSQDAA